jgi:hypothetical protein
VLYDFEVSMLKNMSTVFPQSLKQLGVKKYAKALSNIEFFLRTHTTFPFMPFFTLFNGNLKFVLLVSLIIDFYHIYYLITFAWSTLLGVVIQDVNSTCNSGDCE